MCSCHSILECCVTFSGVKLSIRSFVLFLQLVNGRFSIRVLCVVGQSPNPTFLLDEVWDGLTDRRFGVIAAVHFRCGCIDCLHEFLT